MRTPRPGDDGQRGSRTNDGSELLHRTGSPPTPQIVCRRFTVATQNTRQGFADLELPQVGLIIKNVVLHETVKSRWIAWPALPNERGKGWTSCLVFAPDTDRDAFQRAAIAAIDRHINGPEESGYDLPFMMP